MSILQDLLTEVAAFCASEGITETTFGLRAVNDGKIIGRIRAGKTITVATVDKARAFMAAERAKTKSPESPGGDHAPGDQGAEAEPQDHSARDQGGAAQAPSRAA